MSLRPEAFARLRAAFEHALDLPPEARGAQLATQLGDAPALLEEALAMLALDAAQQESDTPGPLGAGFLEAPGPRTIGAAAAGGAGPALEVGQVLSGFTLVRPLGRGGMGEVWEARQARPDRRVALKVLHAGGATLRDRDGARARRRFEEEAELLARLDHPGIARVLAAGVWEPESGAAPRPWFALELVRDARPLTEFAMGLPLHERLRLLREVCDAVHHGHLRGVVHRDLKPANLLVGADGRLRVIDFGIAHAAGEDGPRHTAAGELLGTLGFMAPEQVEGREREVDARADVFALGVLLHELLVGASPWDAQAPSWAALAREVTERDPAPPSTRVPGLSRELDWIVARATEKEPERRYASAHELARELTRFERNEPLVAGPPSPMYRAAKFTRRNRGLVGGVLLVLLLATGGAAGTTWGWLRSLDRERRLVAAEARAEERAARALALNAFLDRMLRVSNPLADQVGLAGDTTLVDVLLRASQEIEGAFPEDAALEADTRQLIGVALHGQGRYDAAAEQLEQAWRGYADLGPARAAERLETRRHLGVALAREGDPASGLEHLRAAWDDACQAFGRDAPSAARIESDLAWALLQLDRAAEALEHARAALAVQTSDEREAPAPRTATLSCIARSLRLLGDPEGSAATEAAYRATVESARHEHGPESVQVGFTLGNLGAFLLSRGEMEEALRCMEESVRLQRNGLGPDNAYLATPLYNLATVQQEVGRLEDALQTIEACVALCERAWGPAHPTTIDAVQARGDVLWWMERYADARVDFQRAAEALRGDPARHELAVMMELRVLEMAYFAAAEMEAAEPHARALEARIEALRRDEPAESALHDFASRAWSRVAARRGSAELDGSVGVDGGDAE